MSVFIPSLGGIPYFNPFKRSDWRTYAGYRRNQSVRNWVNPNALKMATTRMVVGFRTVERFETPTGGAGTHTGAIKNPQFRFNAEPRAWCFGQSGESPGTDNYTRQPGAFGLRCAGQTPHQITGSKPDTDVLSDWGRP